METAIQLSFTTLRGGHKFYLPNESKSSLRRKQEGPYFTVL